MIAENNTTYDGQFYKKGEEIWDLGSFVATTVEGRVRGYEGLLQIFTNCRNTMI